MFKIHKDPLRQDFLISTGKGELSCKVLVLAIGIIGKLNKPAYKLPITLKERILYDTVSIDLTGSEVLVVGGGDSTSEYCQ